MSWENKCFHLVLNFSWACDFTIELLLSNRTFPNVGDFFGIFRSFCKIHDNWKFVGYLKKFLSKTVKFLILYHSYKCRIRWIHPQKEIYAGTNMRNIHVKKITSDDQKVISWGILRFLLGHFALSGKNTIKVVVWTNSGSFVKSNNVHKFYWRKRYGDI